ncbi:MAG: hypothetical protein CMC63_01380 [Flavobacteriaceae bacterium]|jgi:uncharacterized protein YxeA|nr:hypothetical protein [Flavobacteriaceae bacterium]|tara:strand:+ start:992 stop:1189 length:198 start_codon:yes stop_codon:yes gene_type:complete
MKNYLIPISILVGSLIIGITIIRSSQMDRFQYVDDNVVFDKSNGTTYFTDKKQYLDRKGDLYQFD